MRPFKRPWLALLIAMTITALAGKVMHGTPLQGVHQSTFPLNGVDTLSGDERGEGVIVPGVPDVSFVTQRLGLRGDSITPTHPKWTNDYPQVRMVGVRKDEIGSQVETGLGAKEVYEDFYLRNEGDYYGEAYLASDADFEAYIFNELFPEGKRIDIDEKDCVVENGIKACVVKLDEYLVKGKTQIRLKTAGDRIGIGNRIRSRNPASQEGEVPEPRTGHLIAAGVLALVLVKYLRWRNFRVTSRR